VRNGSLVACGLIFLLFCTPLFASPTVRTARDRIVFEPSKVAVTAERADSPEKRARGLMYRTSLGDKEAMIFYFERPAYHSFWMYNTRIPLTVVFLNDGFTIVDIKDMAPCAEKDPGSCPSYAPRSPAKYAIEVNQGFAERYGITIGDRVKVERAFHH
jgi:uncharacterized membrane protein (UPF0127 family)